MGKKDSNTTDTAICEQGFKHIVKPNGERVMNQTTVTIQGRDYAWNAKDGLCPEAVLTLEVWIACKAKPYLRKAVALGFDMDDLKQAGHIGALKAAKSYKPETGVPFLAWATNRIKDELNSLCKDPVTAILTDAVDVPDTDRTGENEQSIYLTQLMTRLPNKHSNVLTSFLTVAGEKSPVRAFAEKHNITYNTAQKRLNCAFYQVRRLAS